MQAQTGLETKPSPIQAVGQETLPELLQVLHQVLEHRSCLCLPPRPTEKSLLFSSPGSFPPGSLIQALGQAGAEGSSDRGDQGGPGPHS